MGRKNYRILTNRELQQMYTAVDDDRWAMLIKITVKHGLRNDEARTLQRKHLLFDDKQVDIRESKGAKDRMVAIPSEFVPELREYTDDLSPNDYLFPNRWGNPVSSTYFQQGVVRKAAVNGDLYDPDRWDQEITVDTVSSVVPYQDRIVPHSLRHTFATRKLRAGASLEKVSKILGHKNSSITSQHYSHLNVEDTREVMETETIG
jgi:integrase